MEKLIFSQLTFKEQHAFLTLQRDYPENLEHVNDQRTESYRAVLLNDYLLDINPNIKHTRTVNWYIGKQS